MLILTWGLSCRAVKGASRVSNFEGRAGDMNTEVRHSRSFETFVRKFGGNWPVSKDTLF